MLGKCHTKSYTPSFKVRRSHVSQYSLLPYHLHFDQQYYHLFIQEGSSDQKIVLSQMSFIF